MKIDRKVLLAVFASLLFVGCANEQGPNDPVVSGKQINEERQKNMSEQDKQFFGAGVKEASPDAPAPKMK